MKQSLKRFSSISLSADKTLTTLNPNLILVRRSAIASDSSHQFALPAFYNGLWIDIRYETATGIVELHRESVNETSVNDTLDILLILDYVDPSDDVLTDDDLIVDGALGSGSNSGTSDHTKLSNREVNDQHPISAISGLNDRLATVPSKSITNDQINNLFN